MAYFYTYLGTIPANMLSILLYRYLLGVAAYLLEYYLAHSSILLSSSRAINPILNILISV